MGHSFKEVASLRTDDKKFQENFSKIDWSAHKKDNDNNNDNDKEKEENENDNDDSKQ